VSFATAGARAVTTSPRPSRSPSAPLARRDFQRALDADRVYAGRSLVAYAQRRTDDGVRLGVAVSRRVRGAVRRNRARRRVREAARLGLLSGDWEGAAPGITYDVVLIARPAALDLPFPRLIQEVAAVRERLRR
jgi:ribonuclease P protein component